MNKQQKQFCVDYNLTENQFFGKEEIKGNLNLENLTSIPEGFNPIVVGYLNLRNLTSIPEGFNPTVAWDLNLENLTSIPEGFNPTLGASLNLRNLASIPKGFNPTIGGNLNLRNLTSIPEGFNPIVVGYLDLENLTSIPEGFNPTVGHRLYLESLTSIPEGFNPTVGGNLVLVNIDESIDANKYKMENGHIVEKNGKQYIYADGILSELVHKRGNVYKTKHINRDVYGYLLTDGESWSHGKTISEAKEDLLFKIGDRDKSDYENLTLDSVLPFKDAVVCYRVITGACIEGVKNFLSTRGIKKQDFKISDIIELTKNNYSSETFESFFVRS